MLSRILLIILFCIGVLNLNAQDMKYGLFGEFGIDQTKADFNKLKDIPNCCPQFLNGSGNGISIGALIDYPLAKDYGLIFRASYTSFESKMLSTEGTFVIVNNVIKAGEFNHSLNGYFSKVGLDPLFYYSIFPNLKVNLGMRLAFKLSSQFDQKETVVGPYGSFIDTLGNDIGRLRNNMTGKDIPNASSFSLYGLIGFSYDLPLNKNRSMLISPSIFYYYNLNSQVSDVSWSINSIRPGLALIYSPHETIKKSKDIKKIDTVYKVLDIIATNFNYGKESTKQEILEEDNIETTINYYYRTDTIFTSKVYALDGSLKAIGIGSLGRETSLAKFTIEEFVSNRLQPLLPYIFFEDNVSELSNKYKSISKSEANNFELKQLAKSSTLETYYQILNIIGKRLRENPIAKLRIVGCNSATGAELDNLILSEERSNTVKKYFVDNWGIDANRLQVEKRNLPEMKSTPINEIDKIAENRRVEFYSDNYEILAPIFLYDTLRTSNPPTVRFNLTANADAGLKDWKILASQSNNINFEKSGNDNVPNSIDWQLVQNQRTMPSLNEKVKVNFSILDNKGKSKLFSDELAITYLSISKKRIEKINDMEIDRYNLILFDFNKFDIKSNNQKIVDFIKKNLKPESQVKITGYTDKTGDAQLNIKLSQNRASATKDALGHLNSTAIGDGNKDLYNNELPEGRFYCRTVDIYVETPIK